MEIASRFSEFGILPVVAVTGPDQIISKAVFCTQTGHDLEKKPGVMASSRHRAPVIILVAKLEKFACH